MHARVAIVRFDIYLWQFWGFLPHLDIPDSRHVTILLGVCYSDAHETSLHSAFVNHGRALHYIVGTIRIKCPFLAIERCLYAILVKESSVFELCPDLIELYGLTKVYLQPFIFVLSSAPISITCLPQRGIIVIDSILWSEIVIIIGRSSNFSSKSEVLRFEV